MSHVVAEQPAAAAEAAGSIGGRLMEAVNRLIVLASSLALAAAALVLSSSVLLRHWLGQASYWQDEFSVFLIVGATFLSCAHVQQRRGHVGIEALAELLPPRLNRLRLLLVDVLSLAFCCFFAAKSWTLLHEAWVDGQVSSSTWAPPLWIPYSLMAVGMSLLVVQILLQVANALTPGTAARTST